MRQNPELYPGRGAFSAALDKLADFEGERMSLDQALLALGDRSYGGVMLALTPAAMILPPIFSALATLPLALVSAQLAAGRSAPWIPPSIGSRGLRKGRALWLIDKVRPAARRMESLLRPRLGGLTRPSHARLVGAACLLLSVVLISSVPVAHTLAGLSVAAFAGSLIARDGLACLVGWALLLVCIGVLVAVAVGVRLGLQLI